MCYLIFYLLKMHLTAWSTVIEFHFLCLLWDKSKHSEIFNLMVICINRRWKNRDSVLNKSPKVGKKRKVIGSQKYALVLLFPFLSSSILTNGRSTGILSFDQSIYNGISLMKHLSLGTVHMYEKWWRNHMTSSSFVDVDRSFLTLNI